MSGASLALGVQSPRSQSTGPIRPWSMSPLTYPRVTLNVFVRTEDSRLPPRLSRWRTLPGGNDRLFYRCSLRRSTPGAVQGPFPFELLDESGDLGSLPLVVRHGDDAQRKAWKRGLNAQGRSGTLVAAGVGLTKGTSAVPPGGVRVDGMGPKPAHAKSYQEAPS